MARYVRAPFLALTSTHDPWELVAGGSERRKRRSETIRRCRKDDEACRATSADDRFHLIEGQSAARTSKQAAQQSEFFGGKRRISSFWNHLVLRSGFDLRAVVRVGVERVQSTRGRIGDRGKRE